MIVILPSTTASPLHIFYHGYSQNTQTKLLPFVLFAHTQNEDGKRREIDKQKKRSKNNVNKHTQKTRKIEKE